MLFWLGNVTSDVSVWEYRINFLTKLLCAAELNELEEHVNVIPNFSGYMAGQTMESLILS